MEPTAGPKHLMTGASRRSVDGSARGLIADEVGSCSTEAEGRTPDENRRSGRRRSEDAISDWPREIVNDGNARSRKVSGVFVFGWPDSHR